jgi:hypothetical protein
VTGVSEVSSRRIGLTVVPDQHLQDGELEGDRTGCFCFVRCWAGTFAAAGEEGSYLLGGWAPTGRMMLLAGSPNAGERLSRAGAGAVVASKGKSRKIFANGWWNASADVDGLTWDGRRCESWALLWLSLHQSSGNQTLRRGALRCSVAGSLLPRSLAGQVLFFLTLPSVIHPVSSGTYGARMQSRRSARHWTGDMLGVLSMLGGPKCAAAMPCLPMSINCT